MLRTRTRITLRRRPDRLMITVADIILTDKVILHTTRQEVLLLATQQFQRILKMNESGDMRTIKDVHALLAHASFPVISIHCFLAFVYFNIFVIRHVSCFS